MDYIVNKVMKVTSLRSLWERGQGEQKREKRKMPEELQQVTYSSGKLAGQIEMVAAFKETSQVILF